jgi:hypothetical protein
MLGGNHVEEHGGMFNQVYDSLENMVTHCKTDIPTLALPYQFWLECERRKCWTN